MQVVLVGTPGMETAERMRSGGYLIGRRSQHDRFWTGVIELFICPVENLHRSDVHSTAARKQTVGVLESVCSLVKLIVKLTV